MRLLSKKASQPKESHQLKYSLAHERWHVYEGDTYCYAIHCGDGFSIRVKDCYFTARMELDTHWYVLIDMDKFQLHPKQTYDVIMLF